MLTFSTLPIHDYNAHTQLLGCLHESHLIIVKEVGPRTIPQEDVGSARPPFWSWIPNMECLTAFGSVLLGVLNHPYVLGGGPI